MHYNLDLVYEQYIQPLEYYERIALIEKILQDFKPITKVEKSASLQNTNLLTLKKFKGIAKNLASFITEEDWYMQ